MGSIQKDRCLTINVPEGACKLSSSPLQNFGYPPFVSTSAARANFNMHQVPFHGTAGATSWNEDIFWDVGVILGMVGTHKAKITTHRSPKRPTQRIVRPSNSASANYQMVGTVEQTPLKDQLFDDATEFPVLVGVKLEVISNSSGLTGPIIGRDDQSHHALSQFC